MIHGVLSSSCPVMLMFFSFSFFFSFLFFFSRLIKKMQLVLWKNHNIIHLKDSTFLTLNDVRNWLNGDASCRLCARVRNESLCEQWNGSVDG